MVHKGCIISMIISADQPLQGLICIDKCIIFTCKVTNDVKGVTISGLSVKRSLRLVTIRFPCVSLRCQPLKLLVRLMFMAYQLSMIRTLSLLNPLVSC